MLFKPVLKPFIRIVKASNMSNTVIASNMSNTVAQRKKACVMKLCNFIVMYISYSLSFGEVLHHCLGGMRPSLLESVSCLYSRRRKRRAAIL
jgi:hypothetical protein